MFRKDSYSLIFFFLSTISLHHLWFSVSCHADNLAIWWQTCWWCREQQKVCKIVLVSVKKLEYTGPADKERVASVPQREQMAATPEPLLPKGKRTAVCPEHQIVRWERVKVSESRTLARKRREDHFGSMERKEWTP